MVKNEAIEEFVQAIQQPPVQTDTTYSATVSRVDDEGVVWVNIAGSNKETPTANTSAEVGQGDYVNVEWRNNRLYIAGNYSNPSAGVMRVDVVERTAQVASQAAQNAIDNADVARQAAEQAVSDAGRAKDAADEAGAQAVIAKDSASVAVNSANTALDHLGIVENVVGVLELVSKNGDYRVTDDPEVVPDKWYFTREGTAPNYSYEVVSNPVSIQYELTSDIAVDPDKTYYTRSGSGTEQDPYLYTIVDEPVASEISTYYECIYYELTGIDEAIQNYVSAHLIVDNTGVWLRQDNSEAKMQITTNGITLYDPIGNPIAEYGTETIIGSQDGFHIKLGVNEQGGELGFYQGNYKVAYINENKLYINQSVVVEQMDLGRPYGELDPITSEQIGFGQWSWKVHKNANGYNNLNLKWIG